MALFEEALKITLDPNHEGGFQDNPKDSGNWTGGHVGSGVLVGTNCGISAACYPALPIPDLTQQQIADIYCKDYWNPLYDKIVNQNVANKLFDTGVLMGVNTAVAMLQTTLDTFTLKVDGHFGPVTLKALNIAEPISLLRAYKTVLVAHAISIGAADENKRGDVEDWIRRINS